MADNNTGTFPIQSERLYQALKGKRATVRYMQLPVSRTGIARARVWAHIGRDGSVARLVSEAGEDGDVAGHMA